MKGDSVFLDSNIMIYAYSCTEKNKRLVSESIIIESHSVISTQVLQEIANTLHRKFGNSYNEIKDVLAECKYAVSEIRINTEKTVLKACNIAERYGYSFYDSLIIAAALESGCSKLYSEDMQHGQLIEESLEIINPFL